MSGPIISYGLAQDIVARYAKSGYPDAPVVPEPPPRLRRTRLRTARVLAWAAGRPAAWPSGWRRSSRDAWLQIGDADAGVGLVALVDGDEVGGQRLDLTGVAQPAGVEAAHVGDAARQRLHLGDRLAVLAEHEHVEVDPLDVGIGQQRRADVVEGGADAGLGQQRRGLLGGAALRDR